MAVASHLLGVLKNRRLDLELALRKGWAEVRAEQMVTLYQWSAAAYLVSIGKCSAYPLLAHV